MQKSRKYKLKKVKQAFLRFLLADLSLVQREIRGQHEVKLQKEGHKSKESSQVAAVAESFEHVH